MRPLRQKDKCVSRWKNLICWILTILWMGLIFVFSAQNASDSSQLSGQTAFHAAFWFWPGFSELSTEAQAAWIESVQFWVRKAAHFLVYGGLGALLYGDFLLFHWSRPMKAGWAWVVGTLYAASDEIHQLFVPGRSGQLRDVLLDSAGVAAGILLAVFAVFIFVGGTKRLAAVVEKMVPIMAAVYIVGSLVLIGMNITALPGALKMIFVGAFAPKAILGGAAGITVREAIRYGIARGLFSNEAGMGSTPHAHARAAAKNPHEQGLTAMISVFIDTFVVLNLTVFTILTSGAMATGKDGIALTQEAFVSNFGGFGDIFVAVCLLFFAFSTILGWHFFGEINVRYLFGKKACKVYSVIVAGFIIVGSTLKVDLVWELADFFNGLMVIPNALALLALSGVVVSISRKFGNKLQKEKEH